MKKLAVGLLVAGWIGMGAAQAASTEEVVQGMGQKAVRGAVNSVTGFVEFPMQIYKGYKNGCGLIKNEAGSKTVGTVLGFFRGISHAAGRTAWGGMELVGFWTAAPRVDNFGTPLDAPYAWQNGTQYSIFKPTLKEGVTPIGQKLVHGLADGFAGIAELPGQIVKGVDEGTVATGVGKGVWYWFSREVYGFGGVLTCLVPNPKDNPGFAMETEWPWSGFTE